MVTSADLHGVHVALATPIGPDGDLDPAALDRLLARIIDGGGDGISPTGSTGEGPRLSRAQRVEVTRQVRKHVGGDRLVVPGASALTVADAVAEIGELAEAGADAVLLAPPSYYPIPAAGVTAFYRAVEADAVLPIVLYNIPSMTKIVLPPESVGELATLPGIIGIKDSSRDFEYLQTILYATTDADFAVLTGSDTMLLASLTVGAVGTIAGSVNLVPELGREIYDASLAGDLGRARSAQRKLHDVVMACRVGPPPAGWKAALAWAGVGAADPVPPAVGLTTAEQQTLGARLEALGIGR
ncbi:4-hydroxy-tetrahydrodipicolinate synthase [Microlunatus endophyticus]|uniref:4-hydroxy-tetrahydrodipicolinate synthase n=1 Tax=Microlunatus endophyticus TaxID=1716077 RepID=A0A917S743_9ACTN|nr:dihydrodipicolinate synthase family protein [Microlunatus endophyticus]GGL62468.1 4-hydroxy-tetrahydrodipicolinate synthase [Microlunatus endophyticus]